MFEPRLGVLPLPQRRLWRELHRTPGDFVLYGGTALALRHFNPLLTLKALTFFGDGDLHAVPPEVRERVTRAVDDVDPERIPHFPARPGLLPTKAKS